MASGATQLYYGTTSYLVSRCSIFQAHVYFSQQQDLSDIPLDTETGGFVSFWCPLLSGGQSLTFAKRSHRDVAANYWYTNNPMTEQLAEPVGRDEVPDRYELSSYSDLKVGDCTLHHGWTLYNSQPSDNERYLYILYDRHALDNFVFQSLL